MVTTEDVLAVVARSPHNWGVGRRKWLEDEMAKLGASRDELVKATLPGLESDDRNVRVRAVWALSVLSGPQATEGVLRALSDPVRRVREVALKAVRPHHVGSPEVWNAVRAIADNEAETNHLRQQAFWVLSASVVRDQLPDVAEETFQSLMDSDRFRGSLLIQLCRATSQTPASRAILHEFVQSGSKEEAVMATRALCGHRLMRVDAWLPADIRQRVRDTYDPAPDVYGGVPFCWIPGADAEDLAKEVGYPSAP
jgi:hypothetical protein